MVLIYLKILFIFEIKSLIFLLKYFLTKVRKVILLGDTFHDKDAFLRMTSKVRFLFEDFTKKYEVIFILGNHENKIKIEGIKFHQEYIVDDIHFLHEAIQKLSLIHI